MLKRIIPVLLFLVLFASAAAAQVLPRTSPRTETYKQGERSVNHEASIPRATVQAYFKFMLAHYGTDEYYTSYDLYRIPNTTDLFFGTAYDGTQPIVLLLRKSGTEFSDLSVVKEDGCGLFEPFFFTGRDRVLLVVSNSAPDGGFCGNWTFEVRNGNWKLLGPLEIYDAPHGKGGFQGHSPIENATAKYTNGRYSLTMRGKGPLYSFDDKLLARRGVPLTYSFDGTSWHKQLLLPVDVSAILQTLPRAVIKGRGFGRVVPDERFNGNDSAERTRPRRTLVPPEQLGIIQ